MEETITAVEATRQFSRLLRGVREGRTYVITSHGTPVARIGPVTERDPVADAAWQALLDRLDRQTAIGIGPWTREELYEDES